MRRRRCDLLRSHLEVRESLAEVNGRLHFGPTKTYSSRSVVIPRFLAEMLAHHLAHNVADDPDALVFSISGAPLRHHTFHKRFWLPAINEAAVVKGLRIHDLRHTCAALLIAQGAHPKQIQMHLGHSSITVTMDRYGHLFPDHMEVLLKGLEETFQKARVSVKFRYPGDKSVPVPGRHSARGKAALMRRGRPPGLASAPCSRVRS